jgi:multiple sugar transport system substrate-binding protein
VDGCSWPQMLWKILVPVAAPGLAAAAIFAFMTAWNDYLFAVSLTTTMASKTAPVVVAGFVTDVTTARTLMATRGVLAVLPPLLLALMCQRMIVWADPIDGMSGLDALNADMFPYIRQAMSYGGKQYGTPYYGDIFMYMFDKTAVASAHVAKPPVTLDELKNAALEVKKAGIEYPILKGYKTDVDGLSEFWSMVLASGGHLFNAALDPVYPNEDKTALGVLEWLVDAMHTWKIMDPSCQQMDQTQARDAFLGGQGVFTSNVGNVLPRANNKAYSKRAGDIQITRFPALKDVGKGPMGWARMYGLSAKTQQKDASWQLISFMGGKDKSGAYYTAKDWYLKYGVGYSYKSMDYDPEIVAAQKAAGYDIEVRSQQYATAQMRENISSPWYSEWDRFTQEQIQNVLLQQIKPQAALEASAAKARALKKQG